MDTRPPVVIEAAVNGSTPKTTNPYVPRAPAEIVESALASIDAGASIVHNHNDEPNFGGATRHATEPYAEAWSALRARHPDLLVHPTMAGASADSTIEDRFAHLTDLHALGMLPMATADAGTISLAAPIDGAPPIGLPVTFGNPASDVGWMFEWCRATDTPVHVSCFEPGFLRLVLAHHRAGTLPRRVKIQLYLGGPRALFGLPATRSSVATYTEMLGDSGLPWMVGVIGGDIIGSGLATTIVDAGGNIRVGLEDFAGDRQPRNEELVAEAVASIGPGRRAASVEEAATVLWG